MIVIGCNTGKRVMMGSSMVSDDHFGQFSRALHAGIESNTTFYCHIL